MEVSEKGYRIGKFTKAGKLTFDMRNHFLYFGRKKVAEFDNGQILICNKAIVDKFQLKPKMEDLMVEIIES